MSRRDLHAAATARRKGERGTVIKNPVGKARVCLVYPNVYSIGMSSLGFLGVHAMLNSRSDVFCQRAFLPDPAAINEHVRTRTPVFSLETLTPLADFDLIAFSVSFENDYPNIVKILELSGIPPRAQERSSRHPLVVMGGVCAFSNPEPLAEFVDISFTGEAEGMLHEFMDAYLESPSREDLMRRATEIEGVYVPSMYEVRYLPQGGIATREPLHGAPPSVRRRYCKDISASPVRQLITTPEAEFASMRLIEAQRGCPWSCRFCLAGRVFNPSRKKPLDALSAEISECGGGRVGLVGPSLGDYPHLVDALGMEGVDFSITSLRASRASAELVLAMRGRKSVSIAPEAGTDRLRRHINKKVDRADILEAAGMILGGGIKKLRLYFMIGLPTETPEDIEGIVELVREIRAQSKRGLISLTLSPFVPKPFTDFQREPMARASELKRSIRMVRDGIRTLKGVGMRHDPVKDAFMQGLFAMGDRRVGEVIELVASGMSVKDAARSAGIDMDYYIHRIPTPETQEQLPWDFIQS